MTDIDSALNGVLGAVDATAGASVGTTSLAGPEVSGYLDQVYALEDPNYGDVGTNSDIADALNADAEVLGVLKDAVKDYQKVVDTMVTPAMAAQAADAAATPASAAVFPVAGAGSTDELMAGASQAFATLTDEVMNTEVRGSGDVNEAKLDTVDAELSEDGPEDSEDGEDSGITEKSEIVDGSGDVSADELATQVSSAAPTSPPLAAPMGGLTGAAPNPGAVLTSLSSAAPMMSGMLGGTPAMGTSGDSPVGGTMGSLPSSTAAPSTPNSSRGVSTAEILQMIRDAKSNAASTHTSSAGSSLSSPSSSSTPSSTFSPSRADTGSSAGNSGTSPSTPASGSSTAASGSSSSPSSGPSAPAVGRTVAGGPVDPSLVSGRAVTTSLSSASPSSGGGAPAMAGRGAGGMGMMPMGAMGGLGGAGGGSGSGSSSKYLERLGELRNDNPYLNGTWARGRTVSGVMASVAGTAATGDQDVASSLASPGTRGAADPAASATELRSKWA